MTLANRICRLYISQVGLSSKLKSDLFQVAQFILLCYGPGNQAMQSQRKKKQRDNEEKKKESSRIAKFREENKSDKTVAKKSQTRSKKDKKSNICTKCSFADVDHAHTHCTH